LIGCDVRIEPDRFHLAHVQIELLGSDLWQGRGGTLAKFAEADVDGGRVVRVDRDPRVDLSQIRTRRRAALLTKQLVAEAETDNEGTACLQEFAPGAHFATPFIICDARWTAFRIRGYVPQRHK